MAPLKLSNYYNEVFCLFWWIRQKESFPKISWDLITFAKTVCNGRQNIVLKTSPLGEQVLLDWKSRATDFKLTVQIRSEQLKPLQKAQS